MTGGWNQILVQVIISFAGSGVLIAGVQGIFARRKTKAEAAGLGASATKQITDAAAGVAAMYREANAGLVAEIATVKQAATQAEARAAQADERAEQLRERVEELSEWRESAEELFAAHGEWDAEMAALLKQRGIVTTPPPPLRPKGVRRRR